MPVANGAVTSKFRFTKNFTQSNGQTTPLNFTTYIDYTQNADKTVTATTYLMYVKPRVGTNNETLTEALSSGGGSDAFYITAGVLENGKFRAIPYTETKFLKSDGTLATYTPSSEDLKKGTYPVSNQVRAEMVSSQAGSLNAIAKNNAVEQLKVEPGVTYANAKDAIKKGTAPPASAPPTPGADQGGGGAAGDPPPPPGESSPEEPSSVNINDLVVANQNEGFYESLQFTAGLEYLEYPEKTTSSGQDVLKIEILRYNASTVDTKNLTIKRNPSSKVNGKKQSYGTIYLGLQASISDQNVVNWSPDNMSALDMAIGGFALGVMKNGDVGTAISGIEDAIFGSGERTQAVSTAVKASLTNLAKGTSGSNLFTRITGAIVNPNVELLFNGPQLRPFTFTFNLSPRNSTEAKHIKAIIKALKQSSAVQLGVGNLFLKTPFIYKLTYCTEGLKEHQSLNRIKECALTNISIDYTPANVYMTYNDPEKTMTSYSMQLQFTELDPIYGDDYKKEDSTTGQVNVGSIGY